MTTILISLTIGLAVGIMANFLYGMFVRPRELHLRAYISSRRTRFSRARAVRTLIAAARGESDTLEVTLLKFTMSLLLIALAALMTVLFLVKAADVRASLREARVEKRDAVRSVIDPSRLEAEAPPENASPEKVSSEDQNTEEAAGEEEAREQETGERALENPTAQESAAMRRHLLAKWNEVERLERYGATLRRISLIGVLILGIMGAFWIFFPVESSKAKALSLSRTADTLRRLATLEAQRALALAACRIKDEKTLRAYFDVLYQIARQNEILELVEAIDPWKGRQGHTPGKLGKVKNP